jgi:hypothetical protein
MQMHQIYYFLALAEELHFTRAARRCGISQPSLTNAIGLLEEDLGGPLFRRKPPITLTALGGAVWLYLNEIAQNVRSARDAARALLDVSGTMLAFVSGRAHACAVDGASAERARAPLLQRDYQPVEVGGDDESGLAARQREHRTVLIGQHDRAGAGADRGAHAGRAIDATNIRRRSDVANSADEIGRRGAKGKTVAHSADRESIRPAVKYERSAATRAANDKASLDDVEADCAVVGVGGGH